MEINETKQEQQISKISERERFIKRESERERQRRRRLKTPN